MSEIFVNTFAPTRIKSILVHLKKLMRVKLGVRFITSMTTGAFDIKRRVGTYYSRHPLCKQQVLTDILERAHQRKAKGRNFKPRLHFSIQSCEDTPNAERIVEMCDHLYVSRTVNEERTFCRKKGLI